jgi:uncharacterized protein YbjT (DUF2867 family)
LEGLTDTRMRILITGGTGHLGRDVVSEAVDAGHTVRIMSRRRAPERATTEWAQADLSTGKGIAPALEGVDAVVHAARDPRNSAVADVDGARLLARSARQVGVAHFVFVSIIGIDRIPLPYYRDKLLAERTIRDTGLPYSILRAAQFHYFVDQLLHWMARAPLVLPVPSGFQVQSIGTRDVAAALCRIVGARPEGLLPDLAGPEVMTVVQAAKAWLQAQSVRRFVVPVPMVGAVSAGFRRGHNTVPDRPAGEERWRDWLERRYGDGATAAGPATTDT